MQLIKKYQNEVLIKRKRILKNLSFLKISSFFLFIILLFSCEVDSKLNKVSLITNKKVIMSVTSINYKTSSSFKFNWFNHPLERDIDFDANGKILRVGKSKAEGLLFSYKNPGKMQLGLSIEDLNYQLKIDTLNHFIIENEDTIRSFKVNHNKKIIYSENKRTGRISIYSFK